MRANAFALLALLMRQSGLFISLDFRFKIFCAFVFYIFEALNLQTRQIMLKPTFFYFQLHRHLALDTPFLLTRGQTNNNKPQARSLRGNGHLRFFFYLARNRDPGFTVLHTFAVPCERTMREHVWLSQLLQMEGFLAVSFKSSSPQYNRKSMEDFLRFDSKIFSVNLLLE